MSERQRASGDWTGEDDEGGDAACWANRVCPACGRLADEEPPTKCAECGTEIAGPDD